ncbi:MAG TPA: hypothetical protein VK963_04185 [Candidatus Saccharimonadales bacterium]|nr:hypothetical protein [Candidatus Saccharimonadales bacterium]
MPVPIVLCCHLRYLDVHQRPQRIAQLLAQQQPVIYVEEPWWPIGEERRFEKPPRLELSYAKQLGTTGNLTVVRPVVPQQEVDLPYVTPENEAASRQMVAEYLARIGVNRAILWAYSPMMDGYYGGMVDELVVIHDKMDELEGFIDTPPVLLERERSLIARADVMFTGGQRMFENARARHPNCHRFDSGVDFGHFSAASLPETPVADVLLSLPHPIFGYYGVIDERVDFAALTALADAYPKGTVFMGGPVRKIDPSRLPRSNNLVYYYDLDIARGRAPYPAGSLPYADLPRYLKGFDVALIPFSGQTEATRNLSPTKTPEYAAGMTPIISGAIPDLVAGWGDVAWVANNPGQYVQAAADILNGGHKERLRRAQERASRQGWHLIVAAMMEQVERARQQC